MCLEVGFHSESELLYKYFLKLADIILLVKDEHRFFIFDCVDSSERDRTILVSNQDCVTYYTCCSFVPIIKRLNI